MSEASATKLPREERLAAKLRENLRRRKTQSRETSRALDESDAPTETLPNPPSES